jgi:hypothetical protein
MDEFQEIRKAVIPALEALQRAIEDFGGCDHQVGICMCPEIRALERASEAIGWEPGYRKWGESEEEKAL